MTFKGKMDKWWYVVIGVLNGITLGTTIYAGIAKAYPTLIILLIVDLYFIPPIFKNEGILDKKMITIHFGLLKKTVPVQEIVAVRRMKSYSASFAASFQRVGIESRRQTTVFLSVQDNKEFINELLKLNKKIKYYV